jgi:hypothetical protein
MSIAFNDIVHVLHAFGLLLLPLNILSHLTLETIQLHIAQYLSV